MKICGVRSVFVGKIPGILDKHREYKTQ